MKKRLFFVCILLSAVEGLFAWEGSGTSDSPYLISTTADWQELAAQVAAGNSFSGKTFRLEANVNAKGTAVGTDAAPFSGIFDGADHTLTFNRASNGQGDEQKTGEMCAPFAYVANAEISNLTTSGRISTTHQFGAGIVGLINGDGPTVLRNCDSDVQVISQHPQNNDAAGGLVGAVNKGGLEMTNCVFAGGIYVENGPAGGLVGWSNVDIAISYSMVVPGKRFTASTGETFARMASGANCNLSQCYYTQGISTSRQGQCVFTTVSVPEGCSAEILSEPMVKFRNANYYTSGIQVRLTVPAGTSFDHWTSAAGVACHVSDPWLANGVVTLSCSYGQPKLEIATSMPEPIQERERMGINYRYLSNRDYLLYLSEETCQQKSYQFDSDGYLFVYDPDGTKTYITAVTGCDPDDELFQNYVTSGWIWSTHQYEGSIVMNDLVADLWEHTHLAVIAPHAFQGVTQLKKLVFASNDASKFRSDCMIAPDFHIGERAFEGCTNLSELVMMYYNHKTEHWDVLGPTSGVTIAANAFEGSKCRIVTDQSVYQQFLGDDNWLSHQTRIGLYMSTAEDIRQDGVVYSYMRDGQGEPVKNDASGHAAMMNTLRLWNPNFYNFSGRSLLARQDYKNIWYTQIIGVDDASLDNGKMIIRNDPGTYYNYKTVAIKENAFAGNENLKAIEFYQVVGDRSSFSDLKLVIQNGAFRDCKNLKELRMFYYCQDGDDHWMSLGPQDVIPGDNIFGLKFYTDEELANIGQTEATEKPEVPKDFHILVAPERIQEFLEDPNWAPYLAYIQAADLTAVDDNQDDFTITGSNGLTYGYITNLGGIRETSQTVSQDISWWTLPRIAVEVALWIATYGAYGAAKAASTAAEAAENAADAAATQKLFTEGQAIVNQAAEATASLNDLATDYFVKCGGKTLKELGLSVTPVQKSAMEKAGILIKGKIIDMKQFYANVNQLTEGEFMKGGFQALQAAYRNSSMDVSGQVIIAVDAVKQHDAARLALAAAGLTTTAGHVSSFCWDRYDGEGMKKGMRENIRSNMHQVSSHVLGYVYTTPQKNLVYHTYVKSVADDLKDAVIYAGTDRGQGKNASCVTMTFGRKAFQNKKNLEKVRFFENNISTNEGVPMLLTIPDSAFYGCDNLVEFSTILDSNNGQQALGPESFILAGDSVFVGLDSLKFHILIDESRKEDYLASESWAPLKRYFKYTNVLPEREHNEYGAWYAYAYENGSLQKVHKQEGHKIEHTIVSEPYEIFLSRTDGALKLCNDIGEYNNYQLDAVRYKAFFGNKMLKVVNFTDLNSALMFGDAYTTLDIVLEDSCFANCPNLKYLEMLYLVNDGINHIDPLRPEQVRLGRGVLDGTKAQIKMMPQQLRWFEADTTWAKYRDRFLPCVIQPADDEVLKALKDIAYTDHASTGFEDQHWTDYIDLANIRDSQHGFDWLSGKLRGKSIRSFNDFKYLECLGLDYVGVDWFRDCALLSSISLPSTIGQIQDRAFKGCASLNTIEIPAKVFRIEAEAFSGCTSLTSVRVLGAEPAQLVGTGNFEKNDGLKIYVPDSCVALYKEKWAEYKDYIVSDKTLRGRKVVTVKEKGQLAQELGLGLHKENEKIRYLIGNYADIDSLTVSGELNGDDLGVIRHLAGADAYDSDPTDGKLRYLNLWDATIKRDDEHSYNGNGGDEYIDEDNKVPDYLFENCTSIQTVILPKRATYIGENIFEDATSLRQVCVGPATTTYECDILQSLGGIEELVLLTDGHATSDYDDPWEAPILATYTTNKQLPNYMGDFGLTRRSSFVMAPFEDDAVIQALTDHGHFFPNDYFGLEDLGELFAHSHIEHFDDFRKFSKVKHLGRTFVNAFDMISVTLPDSLKTIGYETFAGCVSLDTIRVLCDSVPEMAPGALRDLPKHFRILVPRRLCKLYRTKWAEYADHINVDNSYFADEEVITVTLTEPNTLAEALGLKKTEGGDLLGESCLNGISGDYSNVRKLKVVGPISGADFDLMRHMAGWCPWMHTRNMAGHLEYVDLYDANIVKSDWDVNGELPGIYGNSGHLFDVTTDELPHHAFLKAYNLKTIILPKSCKKVRERALQECEGLEVIVVGDDCEDFNWNALDDDASLTRMYILAKKKMEFSSQNAIWRWLCNNYNPTFDAFYVRPSQLNEYRNDPDYTGSSWQRTNNIQRGIFTTDEEFSLFGAHAAVTYDDLATVTDVNGWFRSHEDVSDLTALGYTSVGSLRVSDLQKLPKLKKIDLPTSFEGFYDDLTQADDQAPAAGNRPFALACQLRSVNLASCDSALVVDEWRGDIKQKLGINNVALVYVPKYYGPTDEHNVVWGTDSTNFQNNYFDLADTLDYFVPLAFTTRHIANSRVLKPRTGAATSNYTVCLPYDLPVPAGTKAYKLDGRRGSTLVFLEELVRLSAGTPYLLTLTREDATLGSDLQQTIHTTVGAEAATGHGHGQIDVPGYSMRGTIKAIDNATAHDLGAYILQSDGKWHPVPAGAEAVNIPAFRTYLLENGGASGVRAFDMIFLDDVTDGIDSLQTVDADGTERLYDLNGRRIDAPRQHGVYIKSGKKFVNN